MHFGVFQLFFLLVILTITYAGHRYLWKRWIRDTELSRPWSTILSVALTLLGLSLPLNMVMSRTVHRAGIAPLIWTAYIWMGFAFLAISLTGLGDFFRLNAKLIKRVQRSKDSTAEPKPSELTSERRRFFRRAMAASTAGLSATLGAKAVYDTYERFVVKRVEVPLKRLDPIFDGFRIVQISDVHIGPMLGESFVDLICEKIATLDADIVVITGDLVDGTVDMLGQEISKFKEMKQRHGIFFVTGNHEYYSGVEDWVPFLNEQGIQVLDNRRVAIEKDGSAIDLAGVHDFSAERVAQAPWISDIQNALKGRDPSRELILLAHQPRHIEEAVKHGVGLQLSGHTHGGQLWPFTYLVALVQPLAAGLAQFDKTWLYVSRGTGYWGPPMRIAAPAEITEVILRAT